MNEAPMPANGAGRLLVVQEQTDQVHCRPFT